MTKTGMREMFRVHRDRSGARCGPIGCVTPTELASPETTGRYGICRKRLAAE